MTDRPFDSRHSGEILRDGHGGHSADGAGDTLSRGLFAVVRHARQLTRSPARERTERLGRDRLLAAASVRARPGLDDKNPFGDRGLWSRLREASRLDALGNSRAFGAWGAVAAVACLAALSYTLLSRTPGALPASPLAAAVPAPEQPLTYSTSGGQPAASNYLVAPVQASASLRFSDGSQVTASPASRLRVDSVQARGARVLLEEGVARANITHREHTNWVFVAGPFDVRITGTTFTLAWDAADQVLDLTLHEGSVEVASPLGASHIKVKTGQHFHASVTDGTMQLMAADAEHSAGASEAAADPQLAAARTADQAEHAKAGDRSQPPYRSRAARLAHRRTKSAERRAARLAEREEAASRSDQKGLPLAAASYADLVRAGAFEQVVNAATQAGLAQTLARNSAEDVRALADAARYLHRTELAVRSLTVLRARFPGSHHSAAAAFLLGRTYENAEQAEAARRFYDLYERESPSGEFAAEALAGRMRTAAALEGESAGRAIAKQYLERYPRGVHAKTARQLLQ